MNKTKKALLAGIAACSLLLTACSSATSEPEESAPADTETQSQIEQQTVTLLMNYFAQAEQAGYWDAMHNQYAKDAGITLDVIQGGPGINTIPQVASGSYDFGVGQADDIINARESGLDVVVVAGGIDQTLFVIMTHASENIDSFSDLNGHLVATRTGALYWSYLAKKFNLDDVKKVNFAGSMAEFKMKTDLNQQGYATSDVKRARDAGIDVEVLSVAKDGGYNPYSQVLFTTQEMIDTKPDVVREVVHAVIKGWENFLKNPEDAKKAVLKANSNMDPDIYDSSAQVLIDNKDEYFTSPPGQMKAERWQELKEQLVSIDALPEDFDVSKTWTEEFLP